MQLILGDCLERLKDIPDNSVHSVISDIPYGINADDWDVLHSNRNSALGGSSVAQKMAGEVFKRRGKPFNGWSSEDRLIAREYQEWCGQWASECLRVLKDGALCFIFAGNRFSHRCACSLEDAGFTFRGNLYWEKQSAFFRAQRLSVVYDRRKDPESANDWEGWRLGSPRPIVEAVLWFQKPYRIGSTIADNVLKNGVGAWNVAAFSHSLREKVENIVKVETKGDSGFHPTQKPLKLMEFLVELCTVEGQVVLDPFMGSGTTGVACKALGREFIGIEKDEKYFEIARERINGTV